MPRTKGPRSDILTNLRTPHRHPRSSRFQSSTESQDTQVGLMKQERDSDDEAMAGPSEKRRKKEPSSSPNGHFAAAQYSEYSITATTPASRKSVKDVETDASSPLTDVELPATEAGVSQMLTQDTSGESKPQSSTSSLRSESEHDTEAAPGSVDSLGLERNRSVSLILVPSYLRILSPTSHLQPSTLILPSQVPTVTPGAFSDASQDLSEEVMSPEHELEEQSQGRYIPPSTIFTSTLPLGRDGDMGVHFTPSRNEDVTLTTNRNGSGEYVEDLADRPSRDSSVVVAMNEIQQSTPTLTDLADVYVPRVQRSNEHEGMASENEFIQADLLPLTYHQELSYHKESDAKEIPSIGAIAAANSSADSVVGMTSHAMPAQETDEIEITSFVESSSSGHTLNTKQLAAPQEPSLLCTYTCPICFSPPTSGVLIPCGHVCCGECLFVAVKTTLRRGMEPGGVARCPVCRTVIVGWDGIGGGIIPLKPRTAMTL